MTGLERTSGLDWLDYEPSRSDMDEMTLYNAAQDLKRLARDKRFVSFSDRELLEEIQKYTNILLERGAQ